VHVAGHKPFERVRFLGYTNSQSMKTHLPWELDGMVILEDESQARFLVRAKDIKMIVIPSEGAAELNTDTNPDMNADTNADNQP